MKTSVHSKKQRQVQRKNQRLNRLKQDAGLVIHDLTELKTARNVKTIAATESRDAAIRECRRKVEKISRECRMDNIKYRDPHFDLSNAAKYCLHGLEQEAGNDEAVSDPATAKRVGDIYEDPHFYVDGIEAGDIKQGNAGDCWFLAAVATIANMSTLLESICVARDEKAGVYGFIFFRDGEWISEIIDDQLFIKNPDYADADSGMKEAFPTEDKYIKAAQRGSDALSFAKCADSNETWLPLLEKAFAKVHGDYTAIVGGETGEGVEDLTGGVTSEILSADILDRDEFWTEQMLKVNKELLFAGAICGINASTVNGVYTYHAYSVLQAVEANGKRFVQVRNPWGKSEWTGAWSDGSSEWTPEWMTALDHKFGDDGAFWMTYEDFLKTFTQIDRTRVFTPEWTVAQSWTQYQVEWPAKFSNQEFRVTLSKSGPVVLVLQQADTRYFHGLDGQYSFTMNFRIRREGESEYYARSKQGICLTRSVSKELQLEAGTWLVSFRITRRKNNKPCRSENVEKFKESQSDKYLQAARNFDFAHAKGLKEEEEKTEETEETKEQAEPEGEEAPATEKEETAEGETKKPEDGEEASDVKDDATEKDDSTTEKDDSTAEKDDNVTNEAEDGDDKDTSDAKEGETEKDDDKEKDDKKDDDKEKDDKKDDEEERKEDDEKKDEEEEKKDEEEDDGEAGEDSTAVIGVRVYTMDPELQVEVIDATTKDMELDPDDSSVTAFLTTASNRSRFLSASMTK